MSDRYNRQMAEQIPELTLVTKTADASLSIREQHVEVDSSSNTVAITLPPVAEAKGLMFVIYVQTYTSAVTIVAPLSEDFSTITFNGVDDGAIMFSDGKRWWTLVERT